MKKILMFLPTILTFTGFTMIFCSVGSDDYSIMHGNGADGNAFLTALAGIAVVLIGSFVSKIRRSAK